MLMPTPKSAVPICSVFTYSDSTLLLENHLGNSSFRTPIVVNFQAHTRLWVQNNKKECGFTPCSGNNCHVSVRSSFNVGVGFFLLAFWHFSACLFSPFHSPTEYLLCCLFTELNVATTFHIKYRNYLIPFMHRHTRGVKDTLLPLLHLL